MPTPSDPNLNRALLSFPSAALSLCVPKEGVPFYAAVTGEEAFTEVVDVVLRRAYGANVPSMSEALAADANHLLTELFAPVVENNNFTEQQLAMLPVSGTLILLVWIAWQSNCVTLTATPTLHTLLDHTDIANDIPASALKLPFPLCYVDLPLTTDDGVVGFFLAAKQETLLVAPVMRAESMHGAFFFEIPLNATSLVEEVNQALRLDLMGNAESPDGKPIEASNVASELSGLLSVALGRAIKILLYSTSSDARKMVVPARSRALEAMKSLGTKKQAKARRKASSLFDAIIIGPETLPAGVTCESNTDGQRAIHWRRGHFRNQAFGVGRNEHKVIFIEPQLIGVKSLGEIGKDVSPKPYSLRDF